MERCFFFINQKMWWTKQGEVYVSVCMFVYVYECHRRYDLIGLGGFKNVNVLSYVWEISRTTPQYIMKWKKFLTSKILKFSENYISLYINMEKDSEKTS